MAPPTPRLEQGLARAALADAQAWQREHEAALALIASAEELEATAERLLMQLEKNEKKVGGGVVVVVGRAVVEREEPASSSPPLALPPSSSAAAAAAAASACFVEAEMDPNNRGSLCPLEATTPCTSTALARKPLPS